MGDIFVFINESLKSVQMVESTLLIFPLYESWFQLQGVINSLNSRYRSLHNMRLWQEVPPHDSKTGVWCVVNINIINGSLFLKTILRGIRNRHSAYFSSSQQMNAGMHSSNKTLLMLLLPIHRWFAGTKDGFISSSLWWATSPNLTMSKFHLWWGTEKQMFTDQILWQLRNWRKYPTECFPYFPRTINQEFKPLTKVSRMYVKQQGVFQHLLQFEQVSFVGLLFQLAVPIFMDPMWMEEQPSLTHESQTIWSDA
jgi:hypothetical protein